MAGDGLRRAKAREAEGVQQAQPKIAQPPRSMTRPAGTWEILRGPVEATSDDSAWRIRDGRWRPAPLELATPHPSEPLLIAQTGQWPNIDARHAPSEGPPRVALLDPSDARAPWPSVGRPRARKPRTSFLLRRHRAVADLELPDGYVACEFWDPAQAEEDFYKFAENQKDIWPSLPATCDLASAGCTRTPPVSCTTSMENGGMSS